LEDAEAYKLIEGVFYNQIPASNMHVPWDTFVRTAKFRHGFDIIDIADVLTQLSVVERRGKSYYLKNRAPFLLFDSAERLRVGRLIEFSKLEVFQEALLRLMVTELEVTNG